jgi:hypothetical protein
LIEFDEVKESGVALLLRGLKQFDNKPAGTTYFKHPLEEESSFSIEEHDTVSSIQ